LVAHDFLLMEVICKVAPTTTCEDIIKPIVRLVLSSSIRFGDTLSLLPHYHDHLVKHTIRCGVERGDSSASIAAA